LNIANGISAYVLAVAFVFSYAYFWLVRAFTKQVIWITGILQIAAGIATGAYYIYEKQYGAGIVFLVFSVFYIICFISWIPRIPFSVLMLQTVIDVAKNYGHVFIVSLVGGVVATAFAAWFSVTLVAVYAKYVPGNASCTTTGGCSWARVIGLIVFITFAGYWISEVIKNVIHVTISGVYGSWYFCAQKPSGFPNGSTRGAFKRAMTTSFGSISFGSLIVAILQLLRQACNIAKQNEQAQGNLVGTIIFCVIGCFISLLDWLIQFFNEYAFSYIALYGKAYIPAAKVSHHIWQSMSSPIFANLLPGYVDNDERPWYRRPRQRMPHQPRPNNGLCLRCLPLRPPFLPLHPIRQYRPREQIHCCRDGICFPYWTPNLQYLPCTD
jgi:hypothetical protein